MAVGCGEKLLGWGKGVLLPTVRLSGAALQKEGPESGAIGAKGLRRLEGPHGPTQGVRLSRSLGRETGWSGDRLCSSTGAPEAAPVS